MSLLFSLCILNVVTLRCDYSSGSSFKSTSYPPEVPSPHSQASTFQSEKPQYCHSPHFLWGLFRICSFLYPQQENQLRATYTVASSLTSLDSVSPLVSLG